VEEWKNGKERKEGISSLLHVLPFLPEKGSVYFSK
jgi:hypothetical protein